MHYRNGREAKNGDKIVQIGGYGDTAGRIAAVGILHGAVPGNDHCNGNIAPIQNPVTNACLCDCLHVDDVADLLKGFEGSFTFHKAPDGVPNTISIFKDGTSDPATPEEIDAILQQLNRVGFDKRPAGK